MTEERKVIKRFKPFILGKCRCGCNKDISLRRRKGYLRKYLTGHQRIGKRAANFKGHRRYKDKRGYWHLWIPDYYKSNKQNHFVREHIYFYETYHKCCILKWGVVHHIDGNKDNSMIWNLQGMTSKDHTILHNRKKEKKKYTRIDTSKRKCSDKRCKHPFDIYFRKSWWFGNEEKGWLCKNCYNRRRYKPIKHKLICNNDLQIWSEP